MSMCNAGRRMKKRKIVLLFAASFASCLAGFGVQPQLYDAAKNGTLNRGASRMAHLKKTSRRVTKTVSRPLPLAAGNGHLDQIPA